MTLNQSTLYQSARHQSTLYQSSLHQSTGHQSTLYQSTLHQSARHQSTDISLRDINLPYISLQDISLPYISLPYISLPYISVLEKRQKIFPTLLQQWYWEMWYDTIYQMNEECNEWSMDVEWPQHQIVESEIILKTGFFFPLQELWWPYERRVMSLN